MEQHYKLGEVTVSRVLELPLSAAPEYVYPEWSANVAAKYGHEIGADAWNPEQNLLNQSLHTWLVRTPKHVILIDSATGNDKPRPNAPVLDHLDTPFLSRLEEAGVRPEQVDYVLHTHLHSDHVGWNTHRVKGVWLPTFPNARHIMPASEYAFYKDPANRHHPNQIVVEDSVYPIVDAGMADMVGSDGGEVLEGFHYLPSPGHSAGHMAIAVESSGESALFAGDLMHHPFQVYSPELNSRYCEQPELAAASRRWGLNYAADRNMLYFSGHFPGSSAGRISRTGNGFKWRDEQ